MSVHTRFKILGATDSRIIVQVDFESQWQAHAQSPCYYATDVFYVPAGTLTT